MGERVGNPKDKSNSAWDNGTEWDEDAYFRFLEWAARQEYQPLWAAIPDVVTDPDATFRNWEKYSPRVEQYGWHLAFVAQDGMTPDDVPDAASIVFIGGSYKWKWRNAAKFSECCDRVHIGRVNTLGKLRRCEDMGVESVDGTGWFRRPEAEFELLEDFFKGKQDNQLNLL